VRTGFDRIATRIVILASLVPVWVFTVSITVPQLWPGNFDYGFFTAVAERLRAGDVLYEEVWDNKDPFVFYSIALARTFGPAGAWALELAWVLLTSGSVFAIARRVDLDRWLSAFVAFAVTPIAMLGVPYFMGSSHLPGIALTLFALAFLVHRRPVAAGVPLAFLVFFKFVMLPLAIAVLVTWAIATRDRRALTRIGASFAITAALIAVVLQIRGELIGFITTQIDNILYSQSPIVSAEQTGLVEKIAQHIVILINPNVLAVEFATAAILLAAWIMHRRGKTTASTKSLDPLWWTTAVAFVASIGIIAATGKWLHHAEIFVVPSTLALVLLVSVASTTRLPAFAIVLITLVAAYLLAGRPAPGFYVEQVRDLPSSWAAAQEEDELTTILRPLEPTSVAFVGRGNLLPRSPGLGDWELACRHMAQRPFNPTSMFEETLECLPSAERVVVTRDYDRDTAFPAYVEFYDSVESLLQQVYECEEINGFRVCERRVSTP